jgi:hypothetical protein
MKRIMTRDGIAEHYGETEDIPEAYVQLDRRWARLDLERALARNANRERVDELARRVVPMDGDRPPGSTADDLLARIQERRAKARAQAAGEDDGMEASA